MNKKTKILYLFACAFFISCIVLGCAKGIKKDVIIAESFKTNVVASTTASSSNGEQTSSSFNIPTVYDNKSEKEIYLFKLTEKTSTGIDYQYPSTNLPKEIFFAKPITINFLNLYNENLKCTYNSTEIKEVKLTYYYFSGSNPVNIQTKTIYDATSTSPITNLSATLTKPNPAYSNNIHINVSLTIDETEIINSNILAKTFNFEFDLKYYEAKTINVENTIKDKNNDDVSLFSWEILKKGGTPDTAREPIGKQTFSSVFLTYSTITKSQPKTVLDLETGSTHTIFEDYDAGLSSIKINGTTYSVNPYVSTEIDPNNGKKYIQFTASGDYTVEILSNEYQEGLDKEYTTKRYNFTIDNGANIVAYSDKDGAEILNFDNNKYQFVSSSVTLKFWGLDVGERIECNYKPAFGGALKINNFKLTAEHLKNGYQFVENGEYSITTSNSSIKTLKFGICSSILTESEKNAVEEKLNTFKTIINENPEQKTMDYNYTKAVKIEKTEFVNTYTVTGLSLQFNVNSNVVTPSSYNYNFIIDYATQPTIVINPMLENGKSTSSSITIQKPSAAGNWTLEVKFGDVVKTYYSNNFDKISLNENGRYTVTLTDETGQFVSMTIAKTFKMNTATIFLIIIGVIGTGIMVIIIIRSRFSLQVK